jgi:outer membrane lipoprotein-sorting protein
MQARLMARLVLVAATGIVLGVPSLAQSAKTPPPSWNATVTKEQPGVTAQAFDAKQTELIGKVTAYFNEMGDMKGMFVQTSADNKRLRGKFFVKRPTFFRFEYNPPSRQLIVSDGTYMAIQDHDLKTDDRYGLDRTPFRILLRKDVDLMRDARILEVGEEGDRIVLALQDKNPDTVGRIKLYLSQKPALELKEWVTTDSQGLDTRVELTEFAKAEDLDPKLFVPPPVTLQRLQQ